MSTFTFKLVTGGSAKYKKDSGPSHRLRQDDNIDPTQGTSGSIDSLLITSARGSDTIYAGDTVIIKAADDSTTSTTVLSLANIDATYDALNGLFTRAGYTTATTTEVNAGTDSAKAVTPSTLALWWTYIKGLAQTFTDYLSAKGFKITGTGGAGYTEYIPQSSNPGTPASGFRLFAGSTGIFQWIGSNGFLRMFDGSSITADRTYTLPNASTTFVGTDNAQTLTNKTIDGGSNTVTGLNASSITAGTISTGRLPVSSILTYTTKQVFNGGIAYNVRTKTTAYTILNGTSGDYLVLADATSAGITQTLPTAVGNTGSVYVIKKIDVSANAVTVATTSSQTIDGSTTYSLPSQWKRVMVMSDGANWQIIDAN